MINIPQQPSMMCYNEPAKLKHSNAIRKVYRQAAKELHNFEVKVHFNRGGIAVWGETYAKLYQQGKPVVEAYDTSMGMLVRQWDGKNSGHNYYVSTVEQLVSLVQQLARQPFLRF